MASTLHFPERGDALHSAFGSLDAGIIGGSEPRPYQLTTANALWGRQGLSYLPDFLKLTEKYYRAGLRELDFRGDPAGATRRINSWVEEQTLHKINDLIPSGAIGPDSDLILTNAIYFKGTWTSPFAKTSTIDGDFATSGGKVRVPMMHRLGQYGYLDGGEFQALELPYSGGSLSMVVLLPKRPNGLAGFESNLDSSKLAGWLSNLAPEKVEVAFPRFKLECQIELGPTLSTLGMPSAFGPKADFSGIASDRRLMISRVIHKAFVDVNEEGTEAAAATGVMMKRAMAITPPRPPVVFRADRPFLFLIRDLKSNSILFLGRVADPST